METYEEIQTWGTTHYYAEKGSQLCINTDKAEVNIFTNPYFGRMLFIDGVLQSSEKDEKIYHQALVGYCKPTGRVLIAGGAEGATAREVLNTYEISNVLMVDWDKELVDIMRKEVFCQGVFENPLLEVIHEDIMKFLNGTCEIYDSVIIDLLDPHTEDEIKWLSAVCVLAFTRIHKGTLVLNAGGNYQIMLRLMRVIEESCSCKAEYTSIFVPSFQELWYLIRICKV
jgi:spermidine synthase